jgi:uncharacterized membrane protein HdeD (DUF308 family)
MFAKLLDSIRNIFASPERRLELRTRKLAEQATQDFDNLQKTIKGWEYEIAEHQKIVNDREQFLRDNSDTMVDQNVRRNSDNKRAYMLLTGVMLIGCVLSVKGLKFFFGEFYASISLFMIIPVALILAGVMVVGSIYLNNFSNRFRVENGEQSFVFYQLKAAAYAMVLFIPSMNLLEGFDSNYRPVVMALNIVGCTIDIILHTSLVSMSNVFTTAEDSKRAIKIMRLKDKALAAADKKLRAFNDTFIRVKTMFTRSAKQFVINYKELQAKNAESAANTLFLIDNFTIWMINNKVMQHALIPYHADENGHPVVELKYFTPEQDSIRHGWDVLSTVHVETTNNQQAAILNGQRQFPDITEGNDQQQRIQEQASIENTPIQDIESEQTVNHPEDYSTIMDNINPNDKIL